MNLRLADGTTVQLSGGSRLAYAANAHGRRAEFEGMAFFEVAHDAARPFRLATFNAEIEVLGTRFGVRAWPGDARPHTEVALETGRVRLAPKEGDVAAVLQPGQTRIVRADTLLGARAAAPAQALLWRSGGVSFVDQPLGDVFREIERRYGLRVRVRDAGVEAMRVTYLNARPAAPSDILADLAQPRGLSFRRTRDGYEVTRRAEAPPR